MHSSRNAASLTGLMILAALGVTSLPTAAQTVVTGHHDNGGPNSIGYATNTPGAYLVPADTGTALDATFNGNSVGFYVSSSTVVVIGGQFNGNSNVGLYVSGIGATVTGGQFSGDANFGLAAGGSPVTVTGGQFGTGPLGANGYDLLTNGGASMDIYGQFAGLSLGQTQDLPTLGNGYTGSFIGTLHNDTVAQKFTFMNYGRMTLHDVAPAPEPSQTAALALGTIALVGLVLKARRRKATDF
jgi:hypothetical protein